MTYDPYQPRHGQPDPYGQPTQPPGYGQYGAPQPGYVVPQPVYGYAPVATPSSGKATASLVLGILGFFTCGLTSIVGVILGHIALNETKDGRMTGRSQAVWGVILSWIPTVGWLLWWLLVLVGAVSAPFVAGSTGTPTPSFSYATPAAS